MLYENNNNNNIKDFTSNKTILGYNYIMVYPNIDTVYTNWILIFDNSYV